MDDRGDLRIRLAVPEDASTLRCWDGKPHVRAAISNDGNVSFKCGWDEELAPRSDGTEFFIAEVDSLPIGALQIINPATERRLDIWIGEESCLGCGYGSEMMHFALIRCFDVSEVRAIVIDPLANNLRAHRFYRRLGFEFVERRVFDDTSDCHVFRLERAAWEATSWQRQGSGKRAPRTSTR